MSRRGQIALRVVGLLAACILVLSVAVEPVDAGRQRARRRTRADAARGPSPSRARISVSAPEGKVTFELSPHENPVCVREGAVRVTISCSTEYRLAVRADKLRDRTAGHSESARHLLIRRSGTKKWFRLSSEWLQLLTQEAASDTDATRTYEFDLKADCAADESAWLLEGGDYLGRLVFSLRAKRPVQNPGDAPSTPGGAPGDAGPATPGSGNSPAPQNPPAPSNESSSGETPGAVETSPTAP